MDTFYYTIKNNVVDNIDNAMLAQFGENNYLVTTQYPDNNSTFPCVVVTEINNLPDYNFATGCDYNSVTNHEYEIQVHSNLQFGAEEEINIILRLIEQSVYTLGLKRTYYSNNIDNYNNRHIKRKILRMGNKILNSNMTSYFPR